VQEPESTSSENREEIEKADQAFFNQKGNATDKFDEVDANVHRTIENPLTESVGPEVKKEALPEDVKWTEQKNAES
jgi:hypothetical protein